MIKRLNETVYMYATMHLHELIIDIINLLKN